MTRLIPMETAKRQGPARSPTVLDNPSADSTKADAHCAMDISAAPAQIISTKPRKNIGVLKRVRIVMLLPSSTSGSIGQETVKHQEVPVSEDISKPFRLPSRAKTVPNQVRLIRSRARSATNMFPPTLQPV